MANIEPVNPAAIKAGQTGKGVKTTKDFNAFLQGVSAYGPTVGTYGSMYSTPDSQAVLGAAFSGVSSTAQVTGQGYAPTMAYGGLASHGGASYAKYTPGMGLPGGGNEPVIPGTEGFGTSDLINSMNQNNLQLLELQAVMQSNMQAWNTKSNILSADHRARMAMIEKFTARG